MKERIKKAKKFSFKRALMYVTTYILVTFGVSMFMIVQSNNTTSTSTSQISQTQEAGPVQKLVTKLLSYEDFSVCVDASVSSGDTQIVDMQVNADAIVSSELDVQLDAQISANIYNQPLNANLIYKDGYMYVNMLDGNYAISSSNCINTILDILKVYGINISADISSSLDPTMLVKLDQQAQVLPLDNGYSITLNVGGVSLVMLCDNDYNLTNVTLSQIDTANCSINVQIALTHYNTNVNIVKPNGYTDITDIFPVVSAVANTINKGTYLDGNITYKGISISTLVNYQNNNFEMYASGSLINQNVQLLYSNKTLYVDGGIFKTYIDINDIDEYKEVISSVLGFDASSVNIAGEIINNIDLNAISIDVIKNCTQVGDLVTLTLNNGMQLIFDIQNKTLNNVTFDNGDLNITLNIVEGEVNLPVVNKIDYFNATNILPLSNTIKTIVNTKCVSGNILLDCDSYTLPITYALNFTDGLKAQLSTNIFGLDLTLNYQNDTLYVMLDNYKVKFTNDEISSVMQFIQSKLGGINLTNTNIIFEKINDNLVQVNNGDTLVSLNVVGNLLNNINILANGINIDISINTNTNNIQNVIDGDYTSFDITTELLIDLFENIKNTKIDSSIDVTLNGNTYTIVLKADFENGLNASITTTILDYAVKVIIQNKNIYVDINGTKFVSSFANLNELIKNISAFVSSNSNNTSAINSQYSMLNTSIDYSNLTLSSILSSIKLTTLTKLDGTITLVVDDILGLKENFDLQNPITIVVCTEDKGISTINIESDVMQVNVTLNEVDDTFVVETLSNDDVEKYTNQITDLLPIAIGVKNLINAQTIKSYVYVNVDNQSYQFVLNYVNNDGNIRANINGELFGSVLDITYINDVVYLSYKGVKLYFDINDIELYKNTICSVLGVQDISELTKLISSSNINEIGLSSVSTSSNGIIVGLTNGARLIVQQNNNVINTIDVFYNSMRLTLYIEQNIISEVNNVESGYNNAVYLLDFVDEINGIWNNKKVCGTLQLSTQNKTFTIDYIVDFSSTIKAQLQTKYMGLNIQLQLNGNEAYITIDNVTCKFDLDTDIEKLQQFVLDNFGLELPQLSVPNIQVNELNIDTFELSEHQLVVGYNDYVVTLNCENDLLVSTSINGTNINLSLVQTNNELVLNRYTNVLSFTQITKIYDNVVELLQSKKLTANIITTLNNQELNCNVEVDFSDLNNITAYASTNVFGKNVQIYFESNTIYVNVDGIKVYGTIDDINQFIKNIEDTFDIEITSSSFNDIIDTFKTATMQSVLDTIQINSISYHNSLLCVQVYDVLNLNENNLYGENLLELEINLTNNTLSNIDVTLFNYNVQLSNISTLSNVTTLSNENKASYSINLSVLNNYVDDAYNTYNALKIQYGENYGYAFTSDIYARLGETVFEGELELFTIPENVNNAITQKVYAHIHTTAMGLDTNIYYCDKALYINVQGLKLQINATSEDITYLINWLNSNFGTNISTSVGNILSSSLQLPSFESLDLVFNSNNIQLGIDSYALSSTTFNDLLVQIFTSDNALNNVAISTNVTDANISSSDYSTWQDKVGSVENDISRYKNLALFIYNINLGNTTSAIELSNSEVVTLNSESTSTYSNYKTILSFVENLIDYVNVGKYAFNVNLNVYDGTELFSELNDGIIELGISPANDLDLTNLQGFEYDVDYAYGSGSFYTKNSRVDKNPSQPYITHSLQALYNGTTFYGTYSHNEYGNTDKLRASINKNNIREVLSILFKVMGINLGSLQSKLGIPECDLDVANLQSALNIVPVDYSSDLEQLNGTLSNITDILSNITNISYNSSNNIDTFTISIMVNDKQLDVSIVLDNGVLSSIQIGNLAVTSTRTLNCQLTTRSYTGANSYDTSNHYDFSNIATLMKSFVNTTALDYYHVTGNVQLTLIGFIDVNVPVDLKVSIVNGKPVMHLALSNYPIVPGVTNNNTNANILGFFERKQTIDIYYQDGYVYIKCVETGGAYKTQTRETKVSSVYFMDNLDYYLQYIFGFTGSIMSAIQTSVQNNKNRTSSINICDVLHGLSYSNGTYTIVLNTSELAYDDKLGDMTLTINTTKNSAGLDYLNVLGVDITMFDLIRLSTDSSSESDGLKLVDVGSYYNMASEINFMDTYAYGPNAEWKYITSWTRVTTTQTTVSFDTCGGNYISSSTGYVGDNITLPTPTKIIDNGTTKSSYTFAGWYDNAQFSGNEYTFAYYPTTNITLYAKFVDEVVEYYHDVTLIDNISNGTQTFHNLVGTSINIFNTLSVGCTKVIDNGVTRTTYTFEGWFDNENGNGNSVNISAIQNSDVILYAVWSSYTQHYYTISFESGVGSKLDNITKLENTQITLPSYSSSVEVQSGNTYTTYSFDGWYYTDTFAQGTKLDNNYIVCMDLVMYAKWNVQSVVTKYMLNIYDNGVLKYSALQIENANIVTQNVKVDSNTLWYLDSNYTNNYGTLSTMPSNDLTLYVRNKYTVNIVSTYGDNASYNLYQGETIPLNAQSKATFDDGNTRITYTFNGWDNSNIMLNKDYTITASWSVDTKYYYTITFDVAQRYIMNLCAGKYGYKSSPTQPSAIKALQGTTVDLSSYRPTCTAYKTAFRSSTYSYKASGWSTSVPSNYSNGGGSLSYTLSGNTTLYVCWERQ